MKKGLVIVVSLILGVGIFALASNWSVVAETVFKSSVPSERESMRAIYTKVNSLKEQKLTDLMNQKEIKLLFGGDVMMADFVGEYIVESKANPFQFMKEVFPKYDLVVLNMECNISSPNTGTRANKSFAFKAPLESLERLQRSGVDLVSLANNHTMDYGPDALMEQIKLLNEINVGTFGAGKNIKEAFAPKYMIVNNTKFAFLAFNDIENIYGDARSDRPGFAFLNTSQENLVRDAIKEAKANSDIVIVYPHWGTEKTSVVNTTQKYWGKKFIDYGADLVVGAHPHVIQPSEEYKGKMIHYSLGNFVFSGMPAPADVGNMLELVIQNKQIKTQKLIKVKMTYHGFPQVI